MFIPEWSIALAWLPVIAWGVLSALTFRSEQRAYDAGWERGFADRADDLIGKGGRR